MKILSITAQKPHSTGSGTYLTELVKAWNCKGYKQAVVAGIYQDDTVSFPSEVDFYPVYFKTSELPFPIVGMSDIMPYESTRYCDMNAAMLDAFENAFVDAISKAIAELEPDIIFCHHLFLLTALVHKHFGDYKIYALSHGTDLRQMMNCPSLADMVRPEISRLTKLFALHDAQADTIEDIFGPVKHKLSVVGSGYNPQLFNCDGRSDFNGKSISAIGSRLPRIIYAGKLSRPKGVAELLSAVCAINGEVADTGCSSFELVLAGGCQDDSIMAKLEQLPSNIKYLGALPQQELAEAFKTSDVFILPSYFEGLPLVLIEAMASGLVPICTDLLGIRAWIDKEIPSNNVIWLPMPAMKTIDTPLDEEVPIIVKNIEAALEASLAVIATDREVPDTSSLTWDSVATKILT